MNEKQLLKDLERAARGLIVSGVNSPELLDAIILLDALRRSKSEKVKREKEFKSRQISLLAVAEDKSSL